MAVATHKNGWRSAGFALPRGAAGQSVVHVAAMACPAVNFCLGVGSYTDAFGESRSLVVSDVSGRWRARDGPIRAGVRGATWDALDGVSCPSISSCTAIGTYTKTREPNNHVVVTMESNGVWVVPRIHLPAGTEPTGQLTVLNSVSCAAPRECVAAVNLSRVGPVLIVETKGKWTSRPAALPTRGRRGFLAQVSCPANGGCVVTGSYRDAGHGYGEHGLVLTQKGASWQAQRALLPHGVPPGAWAYLSSLTCLSQVRCVAGGLYGPGPPLAAARNLATVQSYQSFLLTRTKHAWDAMTGPHGYPLALDRIACPMSGTCVGASNPATVLVQGSHLWPAKSTFPSILQRGAEFGSVACSRRECFAAGSYQNSTGDNLPLVVATHGGSWRVESVSLPRGGGFHTQVTLDNIACVSTRTCVATGNVSDSLCYGMGNAVECGRGGPVVETRTGGRWTARELVLKRYPGAHITALSCPGPGFCRGVGIWPASNGSRPLFFDQTKSGWAVKQVPEPPDEAWTRWAVPGSLSCATAQFCAAVGRFQTRHGLAFLGLLLTETSGRWKATRAPLPADRRPYNPDASVDSVNCQTAGSCVAIGGYTNREAHREGVILTLSRGKWVATEAPTNPKFTYSYQVSLTSVACSRSGSCVVVGHYDTGQSAHPLIHPLLLSHARGHGWNSTNITAPRGLPRNAGLAPSNVSCPSAGGCIAIGTSSHGRLHGLVLFRWSGKRWTDRVLPVPVNADAGIPIIISAFVCPSAPSCTGVGSYTYTTPAGNNGGQGLILTDRKGTWAAADSPLPASGVSQAGLSAVAAAGPTQYVTVGDYNSDDLPAPEGIIAQSG
jgi:hypothetical protein